MKKTTNTFANAIFEHADKPEIIVPAFYERLAAVEELRGEPDIDLPCYLEQLSSKLEGKDEPDAPVDMAAYLMGVATKLRGERLMLESIRAMPA